ncbi:hypothetical protein SARC_14403 [Sphaeroforma arctica JP610]|uniref:Uncharacterized protein n=1 Tax=Sphaeroforma arctica JP610 TaxID=667725 RepID=A0A0L0F8J3_9EUKA|nr:hypothetical protein SARC_14403 [Sphaeroforma arctica JP610]KNC73035.1 hypothetical protein SARC_14403 [Sphaeroforma arctica JP610]|eukprot:XP_014146937.1 hypothetical protein SARC_14403 [Sphaeroforma arctica JP610]
MTDPSPTGVGHTLPSTPNTNTDTNRLINDSDSPGSTDNTVGGISLVNSALPGRSSQPIQDDQLLLVDEKDVNTVADNASMSTTESKPTVNDRSGKGDGKGKGKWKDKVEGFGTSTIATLKKAAGLIQHDVDHDSVTYKDTDRNTALSVPNGVSEGEANTLNTDHALPRTRSAAPKLSQDSDGSEVIETHTDTLDVLSNAHSFADDVPDGEKRRKTWDDLDASDGESDDTNEKATRRYGQYAHTIV